MTKHHRLEKKGVICVYCDDIRDPAAKKRSIPDHLTHTNYVHPFRIYQCSLCLYRAARIVNVKLHQSFFHSGNANAAIIVCRRVIEGPHLNEDMFFQVWRTGRLNKNKGRFQCLYCSYMNADQALVYAHCSRTHPDYMQCAYDDKDSAKLAHNRFNEECQAAVQRRKEAEASPPPPASQPTPEQAVEQQLGSDAATIAELGVNMSGSEDEEPNEEPRRERTPGPEPERHPKRRTPLKRMLMEDLPGSGDDEFEMPTPVKKIKPSNAPTVSALMPLGPIAKDMKCLLCERSFHYSKRVQHLREMHQVESALTCSECGFKGRGANVMNEIRDHIKAEHTDHGVTASIVRFVVEISRNEMEVIRTFTAPKEKVSSSTTPKNEKEKKNKNTAPLMTNIRESTYLGPLRNDRTEKAKADDAKKKIKQTVPEKGIRSSITSNVPTAVVGGFDFDAEQEIIELTKKFNLKKAQVVIPLEMERSVRDYYDQQNKKQPEVNDEEDEELIEIPMPSKPEPDLIVLDDSDDEPAERSVGQSS